MGVDYYATALIGCEIGLDKTTQAVQQRGCRHDVPPQAKHCPECGKAAWVTCIRTDEEVDGIEYAPKYGLHFKGKEGQVVCLRYSTDHKRAFVGLYSTEDTGGRGGEDAERLPWPDECVKEATREALEPLGLWDEEKFGLWAIQYCSY